MQPTQGDMSLNQIADAVVRGGLLRSVFQPIVDLRTGEVAGLEGLSRPIGIAEHVSPQELFSEQLGASQRVRLERVAREQTIRSIARIRRPGQLLFLNCSPQALLQPGTVKALVDEVGGLEDLETSEIVIEITEDSTNIDEKSLATAAQKLQQAGFQIALDDVGVGGNGLGRVSRIRPSWVKLDRNLIAGIEGDPERRKLIEFLTRLATEIGASVVAEGIETMDELAAVIRLGISHGQGYGLGRPEARPGKTDREIIEVIAGAGVARRISTRQHPLTGMPDRVECEQRMAEIADSPESWETEIALVDLRDLSRINARQGYSAGDQAITTLGRELSERAFGRVRFVGHAGDDRFLLLGEGVQIEAVIEQVAGVIEGRGLGALRGILFEGLMREFEDPSDVFQLHAEVKARADARILSGRSVIRIPMMSAAAAS